MSRLDHSWRVYTPTSRLIRRFSYVAWLHSARPSAPRSLFGSLKDLLHEELIHLLRRRPLR